MHLSYKKKAIASGRKPLSSMPLGEEALPEFNAPSEHYVSVRTQGKETQAESECASVNRGQGSKLGGARHIRTNT